MAPEKIESFIDKKILEKFSDSSNSIESTINYLYENINNLLLILYYLKSLKTFLKFFYQ